MYVRALEKRYDIEELINSNNSHTLMALFEKIWERIKDFFCAGVKGIEDS